MPALADDPLTPRGAATGAAWLAVAGQIAGHRVPGRYDDRPVREIALVTRVVLAAEVLRRCPT